MPVTGKGFAWWKLPAGERSFTATEYPGFEESTEKILAAMNEQDDPFDLVMAHSQGAILTAALLALGRFPGHPRLGYILNGVAWPNPYTNELEELTFTTKDEPSHTPRILLVTGEKDQINPPASQVKVQDALVAAGACVTSLQHSGGHGLPIRNVDAVDQLIGWIAKGVDSLRS